MANLPSALRPGPPSKQEPRRESEPSSAVSSSSHSSFYTPSRFTPQAGTPPVPGQFRRTSSGISDLSARQSLVTADAIPNEPPRRYGTRSRQESNVSSSSSNREDSGLSPPTGYEQDDYFVVSPVSATWTPSRQGSLFSVPSYASISTLAAGPEPAAWDLLAPEGVQSPGSPAGSLPTFERRRKSSGDGSAGDASTLSRGLSKLGSIRKSRLGGKNMGYGPLEDVDEEGESIPIDISDYPDIGAPIMGTTSGPVSGLGLGIADGIEMQSFQALPPSQSMVPGVGQGMGQVRGGHTRGRSLADAKVRDAVQREVQKQDHIVAFIEPGVDLTGLDGSEFAKRNAITTTFQTHEGEGHGREDYGTGEQPVSFMFPDDPKMASWRPTSMKWPYMLLLIVIALMIGALQEVLCQISLRNNGLLVFPDPKDISTLDYFAWKYLPTMVLVTYGVMWQAVDYDVKRLEAFYQLSKPDGALAKDSLNLDYLTFMSYLIPFMAIRSRQWAVVFSSIATLLAGSLIPVLQAASIDIHNPPDQKTDPNKTVNINPIWSRVMTASLGVVALFGASLLISLRRKSGLLSDPKGIAGIAAMATKSHILTDFEGMDTKSNEEIHSALRKRRYRLYKSSLWQGRFLTTAEKKYADPGPSKLKKRMGKTLGKLADNPLPIMLQRKASVPFMIYLGLLSVALPLFLFFQQANSFIVKSTWILTLLATVVKLLWSTLDISVRVVEPLYILSRRHAPARTLTLDYTAVIPGLLSFQAFRNRHYIVALVSLGAILAEVLTVCVTSLGVDGLSFLPGHGGDGSGKNDRPNSTDTFRSFWISFGVAMFIIFYLLFVGTLVATRRHHKFLPRQPGSISSVLALIYSSNMLTDFVEQEYSNSKQMTKHLESLGKKYGLGWFNAKRDNKDHCGVDEEPLMGDYQHGKDWKETRLVDNVGGWEQL